MHAKVDTIVSLFLIPLTSLARITEYPPGALKGPPIVGVVVVVEEYFCIAVTRVLSNDVPR